MTTKGYLLLVLHTHQPFVSCPGSQTEFAENWLFEAITESYIPLLDVCHRWLVDGIPAKLTFSLTPTLTAMLHDPGQQRKYVRYVDERIAALERRFAHPAEDEGLRMAERMHYHRFCRCRDFFDRLWESDLTSVFRRLQDDGLISLLASSATHAYLPLWQPLPAAVKLQIAAGVEQHRALFGKQPLGFWLPECGFYPGVDAFLRDAGIKYFFVDGHAILNARPRPVHGIHAPVHTASGLAAIARDFFVHDRVWRQTGYRADPAYLTGRCEPPFGLRVRSSDQALSAYNPSYAYSRCLEHARRFVSDCGERVRSLAGHLGREPLIGAMFDTEHFGHWWHEGPQWLDLVVRMIASEAPELRIITAEEYLRLYPTNQQVVLSMSSWGWEGYGETWLMGRNDWIYQELFRALEELDAFLHQGPSLSTVQRAYLNQYLREFMLAQSSDWAYMLHAEQNELYVRNKLEGYFTRMKTLLSFAAQDSTESEAVHAMQGEDSMFPGVDLLSMYTKLPADPIAKGAGQSA